MRAWTSSAAETTEVVQILCLCLAGVALVATGVAFWRARPPWPVAAAVASALALAAALTGGRLDGHTDASRLAMGAWVITSIALVLRFMLGWIEPDRQAIGGRRTRLEVDLSGRGVDERDPPG